MEHEAKGHRVSFADRLESWFAGSPARRVLFIVVLTVVSWTAAYLWFAIYRFHVAEGDGGVAIPGTGPAEALSVIGAAALIVFPVIAAARWWRVFAACGAFIALIFVAFLLVFE